MLVAGCKRHKPPPITNLWLSKTQGCARTKEGSLLACWGGSSRAAPHVVRAIVSDRVTVGDEEICAELAEGPRCWKDNEPPHPRSTPEGAITTPTFPGETVLLAAKGDHHACAKTDRNVYCWGANDAGQLGDGTTRSSETPVTVHGVGNVAEIAAGARHTCVRLANGTVSCWGANDSFQLANGTTLPSSTPVATFGLRGVVRIVAAGDATCVVTSDGVGRCWGKNEFGQLGDGTTEPRNVPSPLKTFPPQLP